MFWGHEVRIRSPNPSQPVTSATARSRTKATGCRLRLCPAIRAQQKRSSPEKSPKTPTRATDRQQVAIQCVGKTRGDLGFTIIRTKGSFNSRRCKMPRVFCLMFLATMSGMFLCLQDPASAGLERVRELEVKYISGGLGCGCSNHFCACDVSQIGCALNPGNCQGANPPFRTESHLPYDTCSWGGGWGSACHDQVVKYRCAWLRYWSNRVNGVCQNLIDESDCYKSMTGCTGGTSNGTVWDPTTDSCD